MRLNCFEINSTYSPQDEQTRLFKIYDNTNSRCQINISVTNIFKTVSL